MQLYRCTECSHIVQVRARRAKAEKERAEREAKEAEQEAARAAAVAAQEGSRRPAGGAGGERPVLDVPGPKEIKSTLMALQEAASDEFLKKHGLKGAGGNKLAKIKGAAFKKIFSDFQDNADIAELEKYQAEI